MSKYFSNKEIANMLREVSAAYQVKGGNNFKIIAYQNAADSIEHAASEAKDLWEVGKLDTLPGVGASIKAHISELFTTGKVKHFEEVTEDLPQSMFELMKVRGMGPKTAYKLSKELKIKDLEDLKIKAKRGMIRKLPGFGEKSEKEILTSVGEFKEPTRHLLTEAYPAAEQVLSHLRELKECQQAEPLGSLRRMVATVGDIDLAVSSKEPKKI
ncbi:DNA polymerase III, partial [Candidatus Curtissbacteria bacterium]|nr:DNA polymerase III [Candidatus Curtissbacteria bacterium]